MERRTFPEALEYLLREGYGIKRVGWKHPITSLAEVLWLDRLSIEDLKATDWILI